MYNEATRVQMPARVHLTRLGYTYFRKINESQMGTVYDGDTNILLQVFEQQFKALNPGHEGARPTPCTARTATTPTEPSRAWRWPARPTIPTLRSPTPCSAAPRPSVTSRAWPRFWS